MLQEKDIVKLTSAVGDQIKLINKIEDNFHYMSYENDVNSTDDLMNILQEWNLSCLYDTLTSKFRN